VYGELCAPASLPQERSAMPLNRKAEWDLDFLEKEKISSPSGFEPPIVQSIA